MTETQPESDDGIAEDPKHGQQTPTAVRPKPAERVEQDARGVIAHVVQETGRTPDCDRVWVDGDYDKMADIYYDVKTASSPVVEDVVDAVESYDADWCVVEVDTQPLLRVVAEWIKYDDAGDVDDDYVDEVEATVDAMDTPIPTVDDYAAAVAEVDPDAESLKSETGRVDVTVSTNDETEPL